MSLVIRTWISDEHFVSQTAVQDTLNEAEGSQPVFHPRQNSFECSDDEDNTMSSSGTNSVTENHVTENSGRTSDTTGDPAVTAVAQRGNQVIMVFLWHPALVAMLVIKHKIFSFSPLGTGGKEWAFLNWLVLNNHGHLVTYSKNLQLRTC